MANYLSSNTETPPPIFVDNSDSSNSNATNQQNFSQHARLLPYMEQNPTYNSINFMVGARWGPGNATNDPDSGGPFSVINGTAITTQVSSFLCPSDPNPGRASNSQVVDGQVGTRFTATSNYPSCLGLNRAYNNWAPNGPTYASSSWDGALMNVVALNTFTDGTSNTAIFSEWVKGSGVDPAGGPDKNVLGMVYGNGKSDNSNVAGAPSSPQPYTPGYRNDILASQACQNNSALAQDWSWKGEWAFYGKTMHYTHTNTPNRKACVSDELRPVR